ncbi:MAG: sensory transduction protein kinase [Marmoricola sp.]|nr:sensory transduction protein kinase [Marmoricola sp.]
MGVLDAFSWSRVVVVDDTEASALLARKVLLRSGLRQVDTLVDSRLALDWIAENDPDLVLLDLHMPHLDGYEVLRRLRQRSTSTELPVIVLTADVTVNASQRALELDANDFLVKPLNAVELSHRVRTMLDMRSAHRTMRRHQAWLEAAELFSHELLSGEIDRPFDRLARTVGEIAGATRVCLVPPVQRADCGTGVSAARAWDSTGEVAALPSELAAIARERAFAVDRTSARVSSSSMLVIPVARSEGPIAAVALSRDADREPFTQADGDDARLFLDRGSAAVELMERREERRRYLDFFQTMVSQVAEYAIVGLDAQGAVASWNAGAERVWGYAGRRVLGQHYSTFYGADELDAGVPEDLLRSARDTGRAHFQGWVPRANGVKFWAESSISGLYDDRAVHLGFAVVTRDMTETKNLEQARESFFASVSHDIRAPLTAILGFTEMLSAAEPRRQEEFVQRVRNNVATLGVMVDNMIDHARLQAGALDLTLEALDLDRLAGECVRDLAPVLTEHKVAIFGPGATVMVDRLAFRRVLANLLVNAARYSPPGTPIEIVVDAEAEVGRLVVSDRGRGIEPEDLETIFDEFARGSAAEADGGSGLGLFSVHRLVTMQQGTVAIASIPGEGTSVTIELPLAP